GDPSVAVTRPDRSVQRARPACWGFAMTTLGFRGLLAGTFAMTLGLTAGASHGAQAWSEQAPALAAPETPGLVDRLRYRACAVSQGLSRPSERASAEQRRQDCARKHGIAD